MPAIPVVALLLAPLVQGVSWTQEARLLAKGYNTGTACAVSGDVAVLGAPDSTGFVNPGAAAVHRRSGSTWTLEAGLTASDGAAMDRFGAAVAIEGDTVFVGAPDHASGGWYRSGAVYVFTRQGTDWVETAVLDPDLGSAGSGDRFGSSLALSGDRLAVGAREANASSSVGFAGAVHVFERDANGTWNRTALLTASTAAESDLLGTSVGLYGDTLVAGAPGSFQGGVGYAQVFVHDGTGWIEQATLSAPEGQAGDHFGASVSVWGDTVVVGEPGHAERPGAAYAFDRTGTTWGPAMPIGSVVPELADDFGASVSLLGASLAVGAPMSGPFESGAVYSFVRQVGTWRQKALLPASVPLGQLGAAVANAGTRIVAGAPEEIVGGFSVQIRGQAYDPLTDVFYAVDDQNRLGAAVGQLDTHLVGPIGFANVESLAFDPVAGVLWAADIATDQLLRVDPATGAGTAVGPLGFDQVRGLAFDANTGTLYGSDITTDQLLVIDTSTGVGSVVGPLGKPGLHGLGYDPVAGVLYGLDRGSTELVTIDPSSGATVTVGPTGLALTYSLTFDARRAVAVTVKSSFSPTGYVEIDPATGAAGEPWPFLSFDAGAAYSFTLELAESYCTAGVSASGCQALLSSSGLASASEPSGFELIATGVEGNKNGILFFGVNGRQAAPWGNGSSYRCVVPPVSRAGLLIGSGTAGACDGAFVQDLNALWCPGCPKPLANPGAGALVQTQLWYRDPKSTSNQPTSLSDALELLVGL